MQTSGKSWTSSIVSASTHTPSEQGAAVGPCVLWTGRVEPRHMELVTHAENCRRRHERAGFTGRRCLPRSRVADECSRGHTLTADYVYTVPTTGRRRCKVCRADRMREHFDRVAVEQENRRAAANTDVRPTLDHLVELTCKAIVRAAKRGVLPAKAVSK